MQTFMIEKLRVSGAGKIDGVVSFTDGLNIIRGRSNTGKTWILRCIYYLLGSDQRPYTPSTGYTDIEGVFVTERFGRIRMVNVLNSQSYGVTDFRKRLYWESFANIECVIPSIEEQKKLYRFFVLIDTQINTIKDQIECLNKQRAFCVKKVFSKEVRFSSDSDIFPDWEQCILGDLCDAGIVEMKRGKVIPKQDGSYPVYSSASTNNGLFCYSNEYMFDEELVTWSIDGGGRAFYRPKHKFSVTNVCGYIRVKNYEKINCRYLAYALDYVHSKMGFDYMTKALPTAIENIDVLPIPCIEEQIRISDFIKSFDEAILNKEEILATWERIKTGFMQKMLPCK